MLQSILVSAIVVVAIVASIFAIWPVVADAPWEDSPSASVPAGKDNRDLRCESALELRNSLLTEAPGRDRSRFSQFDRDLRDAKSGVVRFC